DAGRRDHLASHTDRDRTRVRPDKLRRPLRGGRAGSRAFKKGQRMTNTKKNTAGGVTIAGTHALVTGANRGLGKGYVDGLLARGVAGVDDGARNPDTIDITDD